VNNYTAQYLAEVRQQKAALEEELRQKLTEFTQTHGLELNISGWLHKDENGNSYYQVTSTAELIEL
jgi:hypothetical protein